MFFVVTKKQKEVKHFSFTIYSLNTSLYHLFIEPFSFTIYSFTLTLCFPFLSIFKGQAGQGGEVNNSQQEETAGAMAANYEKR